MTADPVHLTSFPNQRAETPPVPQPSAAGPLPSPAAATPANSSTGAAATAAGLTLVGLFQFVASKWGFLTSGTTIGIAVFLFAPIKEGFESYIRGVVYPGLYPTSEEQLKSPDKYLDVAKYIRHLVVPTAEEPLSGTKHYENVEAIKVANAKYVASLQKETTKLLFPGIDKPTPDETIVDWFQKNIKAAEDNKGRIGSILANNHSVVTDSIVGGVYSGSVRLSQDNPNIIVPILVPPTHSVSLLYSVQGTPSTPLYAGIANDRVTTSEVKPLELRSEPGTYERDLTQQFDKVRLSGGPSMAPLQGSFFFIELGYAKREQLKLLREDVRATTETTQTTFERQPITLVYALVVDKGIRIRWNRN